MEIYMLKLVLPIKELREDCINYTREHHVHGETTVSGDGSMSHFDDYSLWIIDRENNRKNINVKPNLVPETTFLVYHNEKLIGLITIRHYLNDSLLIYGGHIGYSIRPSERRKGYGKIMLEKALDYCKNSLNHDKVLITCDKNNEGSKKVIMYNGGILENEICHETMNRITQRYWIRLKNT